MIYITPGKKRKYTRQQVLDILTKNLDLADDANHTWVSRPMAWALYQTWKEIDSKEKLKEVQNEGN